MLATPTTAKERIITVDALRGFALFGIMLAHFIFWYTAGPLPQDLYGKYTDAGSTVAKYFTDIFVSGKFFAFFSFLFGLSFYLQTGEPGENKGRAASRFAWRITLLLLIGMVHHTFWQGDILSIYAPLGFLLLLARRLSTKWALIIALLLIVNLPGKIVAVADLLSPAGSGQAGPDFAAMGAEYDVVIRSKSWLQIFSFNLQNLPNKFDFQIQSGRLYMTMGFFLIGMLIGRKKWFEKGEENRPAWRKLCKRSAAVSSICLAVGLGLIISNEIGKLGLEQNRAIGFLFNILFDVFSASLVLFYISGITLLTFRKSWFRFFNALVPVGKLALTTYLTQTAVGLLLFWGIGFGLYGKTSQGLNYVMAISLFALQVVFSKWWLRHWQYGIAEWLWRSATMLAWQPLRRQKTQPVIRQGSVHTHVTANIEAGS